MAAIRARRPRLDVAISRSRAFTVQAATPLWRWRDGPLNVIVKPGQVTTEFTWRISRRFCRHRSTAHGPGASLTCRTMSRPRRRTSSHSRRSLAGIPEPPSIPFDQAELSPMSTEFLRRKQAHLEPAHNAKTQRPAPLSDLSRGIDGALRQRRVRQRHVTTGIRAEMPDIARIDVVNRQDHQHIRGSEAPVDDGAAANDAPSAQISLIKGGKARSAAFWSMAFFGRRFIDVPCWGRARLPIPRRTSEMVKKAQGKRKRAGIGALKAGAADHDVDPVMRDIGPDSHPQQFDRALVAIGFEHAGAAEFQKPQLRMGCEHRRDIVFARCVETLVSLGDVLTQQPIGADDLRLGASGTYIAGTVVENQQVVAETSKSSTSRLENIVAPFADADISSKKTYNAVSAPGGYRGG